MNNACEFGNGKLNYTEFLVATIDRKEFEDEDHLWTAFKYFDVDNTGYITADNLWAAFRKAGKEISEEEI